VAHSHPVLCRNQEYLLSTVLVAFACNPSYLRGRDQKDSGSKSARGNSSPDPILKKTNHKKKAGGVAQDVGPEFKPQYHTHTHTHIHTQIHNTKKGLME
jgi:hypothetical protein